VAATVSAAAGFARLMKRDPSVARERRERAKTKRFPLDELAHAGKVSYEIEIYSCISNLPCLFFLS